MVWRWYGSSVLVIVLDQWTKWLAESNLVFGQSIPVTSFFNLTLAYNKGAAFSFLANAGGWQRWFFIALALVISVAMIVAIARMKKGHVVLASSMALILGGAIGNVIDRIRFGHVVDFLDVFYGKYHWPAFNIADAAIVVGAGLLILDGFLDKKPDSEKSNSFI